MIIRNSKNGSIVNVDKVTQIYPSISEKQGIFNLYFMFDATNEEGCNEVKWELSSVNEIESILARLDIVEV